MEITDSSEANETNNNNINNTNNARRRIPNDREIRNSFLVEHTNRQIVKENKKFGKQKDKYGTSTPNKKNINNNRYAMWTPQRSRNSIVRMHVYIYSYLFLLFNFVFLFFCLITLKWNVYNYDLIYIFVENIMNYIEFNAHN